MSIVFSLLLTESRKIYFLCKSQPNPFTSGPPPVPVAVANTGPPSPPQTSYETNFDANGGYEESGDYGNNTYGAEPGKFLKSQTSKNKKDRLLYSVSFFNSERKLI